MNKMHRKYSGHRDLGAIKARERKAFVVRMGIICEKMVGPGYFELFPSRLINQMYVGRYPAFKVYIANPKGLTKQDALLFRQSFFRILGMAKVETLIGESIAYSWYLRDVLLLVHYAELSVAGSFSGSASLVKAFEPYFRGSSWYQTYQERTIKFLTFALMHLHDFYKGYLDANIGQLPFQDHRGRNCIRLFRIQPQIIHVNIAGISRPISRMGWYDTKHGTNWTATTARSLGFEMANDTTLLPVYIQQHALKRFHERTMLPPGLVIGYLYDLFTNGLPIYHRTKDHLWWSFL